MSDQNSLFNNSNGGLPPQGNTPPAGNGEGGNSNVDVNTILSGIKNERGEQKYKTLQDALVGLQNAQEFIPQLKGTLAEREAELERLRKEAEKVAELQATIQRLTDQNSSSQNQVKGVSEQDIAAVVDKTLQRQRQEEIARANTQVVVQAVSAAFGADAEKKFYGKAEEMGMSVQEFNALAARSPKLVLSALGITEVKSPVQPGTSAPQSSSVNTAAMQPPVNTMVTRNTKPTLVGATTQDLNQEAANARKMVDELASQGRSVYDLTDPKVYAKHFGLT